MQLIICISAMLVTFRDIIFDREKFSAIGIGCSSAVFYTTYEAQWM